METETARNRSAEARHSRPVRWVINQFEAVKERVEARAGALLDREDPWPEESYTRGRPVASRRRVSSLLEQSELWPSESGARREPTEAELLMRGDAPFADETVADEEPVMEIAPEPQPVKRARRRIIPASRLELRPEKSRTARVNTIVRFLRLNGAVHVPMPNDIYFDFPGRGHFQSLQLWSGSPERPEFNPNQF